MNKERGRLLVIRRVKPINALREINICKKFYKLFLGPLVISEINHPNAFHLVSLKTNKSIGLRHANDLKPFFHQRFCTGILLYFANFRHT